MMRYVGLACLAGVLLASALWAEQGTVKTRDGNTYQGQITDEPGPSVTVTSHGVQTVIARTDIVSVEKLSDYASEFRARLAKLPANDVAGRVVMAREAFNRQQYELARDTLEGAILIDPNSRDAADMLDLVQRHIRLERQKADPNPVPPPTTARVGPAMAPGIERRLLNTADIEAIRRKELRPGDNNVRVRFDGDVKKRFADSQSIAFTEFNSQSSADQAIQILGKGDEDMRSKVHVLSDPQSMLEYRRQVQPFIIQNCATIGCHGSGAGGGLVLYTAGDNDAISYTNFYILQNYSRRVEGGSGGAIFGGSQRGLIERGHGEQSLLANYGLPVNLAVHDHPLVNGKPIPPAFRNREDARYRAIVDWMSNSLGALTPDYGIRYTPPTPLPPTSSPAE